MQVRKAGQGHISQMQGLVEEVDTGEQSQFRSEAELIGFLRDRLTVAHENSPENDGAK